MSFSGIGEVADLIETGINKIWPDKTETQKAEAKQLMAQLEGALELQKAQIEVNAKEAQSNSLWVSGWRPGIGWACAGGFAWVYVLQPAATWVSAALGHPVVLPNVDMTSMYPVMLGMLGLGGMRSFERLKGVDTTRKGHG